MRKPMRLLPIGPDHAPRWVRLSGHPVGDHRAARMVADNVAPPLPGEWQGTGVFGATPVEAKALALRSLGDCVERN
jgi:hypothetical protein